MSQNLVFQAGPKAYALIQDGGLQPDMIKVVAGAAGGPKWLILSHFDRFVLPQLFQERSIPLYLVGSSIGAWRFAALCQNQPAAAAENFLAAYLDQTYSVKPTPTEVSQQCQLILDRYLTPQGVDEVLQQPFLRLNALAVRCHWPNTSDNRLLLGLGLAEAFLVNLINRHWLTALFDRTLFHHPEGFPGGFADQKPSFRTIPLDRANLKPALLASGSVPLVMAGIRIAEKAETAVYRDGGLLDYHLDLPFLSPNDEGLVLFPHYGQRIIPGWLDKQLSHRRPQRRHLDRMLMLSPADCFRKQLPYQKIPDRNDFWTFRHRDAERITYWKTVVDRSQILGNEFLEAVASGNIKKWIRCFS